jgi:3-dehydroshikimate dehydratase
MLSNGMCSVTLRHRPVPEVLEVMAAAGLSCVEWAGDRHVPAGDVEAAAAVLRLGLAAGVRVASYGSYFRAGPHGPDAFVPVLRSAVALRAPRIRIWAGDTGSAAATPQQRRAVAAVSRTAAAMAADEGVRLSFEYHGGTLTDSPESTLTLIEDIGRPDVGTYWQPPVGLSDSDAVDGLERLLPHVTAVHVFSWWPQRQRLPLHDRAALWRSAFALLERTGRDHDALLEFVADDDPARVTEDAATLAGLTSA